MTTTQHPAAGTPPDESREPAVGRWIRRFDRLLVLVGGTSAVLVLAVVGVTLFASVVLRYVSGSSLRFATELPTYLFPWLICGGIIAAAGNNGHLAVDFVVTRLPHPARRAVEVLMWLLVVFAFWVLFTASLRVMDAFAGQTTAILGWPSVGSYLVFPAMLALLMVHSAGRALASVLGIETGAQTFVEAGGTEVPA